MLRPTKELLKWMRMTLLQEDAGVQFQKEQLNTLYTIFLMFIVIMIIRRITVRNKCLLLAE